MPRDGSGGFQLPSGSWNPAINGNAATPNDWNLLREDIRSAIQGSVAADGQTPITGDLKMQNNRVTGLGSPSGDGHALRFEQLKKGSDIASATTITIPMEGALFDVTGTATIETIDGSYPGRVVYLRTTDGCTFKRGATLLVPGGYDLNTAAGSVIRAVSVASGIWLIDSFVGQSLPIFPADAIPTADIGPIYIVGLGEAWWSSSRSKYIALRSVAKYGVAAGNVPITDTVLTLLPLTLGFDDSMDAGIASPNYAATPGLPGLYRCTLVIRAAASPRTTRLFPSVYKNGSAVDYGTDTNLAITSIGSATVAIATTSVVMNGSTDYLQMYAFAQNASGESGSPQIDGINSSMLLEFIK